jgi:bifunctional DNA-binding transcriptional regulator/antitoxin component of YhaV-PrlF toxin-antitoxin module
MKNQNNIRKMTKTGRGTIYVTLPKDVVDSLGWKEHQKLIVKRGKGCVIIRDWKNK